MNTDALSEGLMTVEEVMHFLAVSRTTVWRYMESGTLSYTNIGRARRITRRSVLALAKANLVE